MSSGFTRLSTGQSPSSLDHPLPFLRSKTNLTLWKTSVFLLSRKTSPMTSLEDYIKTMPWDEAYDLKQSIEAISKITGVAPKDFSALHWLLFQQMISHRERQLLTQYPILERRTQ
jgi:hypothetical protein